MQTHRRPFASGARCGHGARIARVGRVGGVGAIVRALAWIVAAIGFALSGGAAGAQSRAGAAVVLDLDGAVGPATADYLVRGIQDAAAQQAAVVLLRINTPGGLDSSMRGIVRAILASPVPVLGYVAPGGARAASAGTYLLYATHLAAMAPATNVGAATPVALGGAPGAPGTPADGDRSRDPSPKGAPSKDAPANEAASGDPSSKDPRTDPPRKDVPRNASEAKAVNDAVAYLRSLAELRGRNADWAERAVRESASLSARAALEQRVIDLVAADLDDLMARAHGRTVAVGDRTVVLETRGLPRVEIEPDWRTRMLAIVTDPNVALLLMMIGLYGLLFEFLSPGALAPGVIGGIALLLGLYSLALLPLDAAGIGLIVLGLALLVAEAFVPSFGVLGLGGLAALGFGIAMLVDVEGLPAFEVRWPIVAGLMAAGLGLVALVGRAAVRSGGHRGATGGEAMLGEPAEVMDWNGASGHVFVRGERWNAVAAAPLAAGSRVRIVALDGLTLRVVPEGAFAPVVAGSTDGPPGADAHHPRRPAP